MQNTFPEIQQIQPTVTHRKELYSAEDAVHVLLDASLTDSAVSEDDESSNIDSESEYDLSDPEAGMNAEDNELNTRHTGYETITSTTEQQRGQSTRHHRGVSTARHGGASIARGRRASTAIFRGANTAQQRGRISIRRQRGRNTRGQRGKSWSRGACGQRENTEELQRSPLEVKDICTKTDVVKEDFPFMPVQPSGFHLPPGIDISSPEELFKLFFGAEIVEYICKATNEYAESLKEKKPVMYKYFNSMSSKEFYKLLAIFIHFGYKKIPRY